MYGPVLAVVGRVRALRAESETRPALAALRQPEAELRLVCVSDSESGGKKREGLKKRKREDRGPKVRARILSWASAAAPNRGRSVARSSEWV